MSKLFKSPNAHNSRTGNITMSYEEYDDCLTGDTSYLVINGENGPFRKDIEPWMLEKARDMDGYMLVPFTENSFLAR